MASGVRSWLSAARRIISMSSVSRVSAVGAIAFTVTP